MIDWKYQKAVPLADANAIVYASQCRESDFSFSNTPLGQSSEVALPA